MDIFKCMICWHEYNPAAGGQMQEIFGRTGLTQLLPDRQSLIFGADKDRFQKM